MNSLAMDQKEQKEVPLSVPSNIADFLTILY